MNVKMIGYVVLIIYSFVKKDDHLTSVSGHHYGAGDGDRTRDLHLGKVSLYQLSHSRPLLEILYTI